LPEAGHGFGIKWEETMGAVKVDPGSSATTRHVPKELTRIRLHHGEAVWVMSRLGFQGTASHSTFYEYVKSLRKFGIPFGRIGLGRRGLANYSYCHLMELALVLTARVYYFVPDSVLAEIIRHRRILYRHYRRAYLDRQSGIGAPIRFSAPHHSPILARGAFLDLQIDFSGGVMTRFGPPTLLSPDQALASFVQHDIASRSLLPINLSLLAERLVAAVSQAPAIRKGPKPANKEHDAPSRSRLEAVS
jgi:hypothetical protein